MAPRATTPAAAIGLLALAAPVWTAAALAEVVGGAAAAELTKVVARMAAEVVEELEAVVDVVEVVFGAADAVVVT